MRYELCREVEDVPVTDAGTLLGVNVVQIHGVEKQQRVGRERNLTVLKANFHIIRKRIYDFHLFVQVEIFFLCTFRDFVKGREMFGEYFDVFSVVRIHDIESSVRNDRLSRWEDPRFCSRDAGRSLKSV